MHDDQDVIRLSVYQSKGDIPSVEEDMCDGLSPGSCPTSGTVVTLKTGRREMPGSNPGRACRPNRSEFSVVFSETRVNAG